MWQMPVCRFCARFHALALSRLYIADERPYSLSLATASASASSLTRIIDFTGPNDSSCQMRISRVTPSSRVARICVESDKPPASRRAPFASASSIKALQRVTVFMSTTGPSRLAGRAAARLVSCATNASATVASTMMRSVDMQICPALANAPKIAPAAACSRSASSSTSSGALPPSSSTAGFRCSPQVRAIIRPTGVEPVKLMRRTAGWAISNSTSAGASAGAQVR